MNLVVEKTSLPGVLIIKPRKFEDQRGYFFETFRQDACLSLGINCGFVQDNLSRSKKNVLRGLHFQWPNPQAKLVSVSHGAIFDVIVDVRRGSPNFGKWFGIDLSAENGWQLFIPEGFAHGFCALSDGATINYKCSTYYSPGSERTLLWSDKSVGIEWPLSQPILSAKDAAGISLNSFGPEDLPEYYGD
jgi:dTDP-4-dehydrorhamnose 3,5-epimerase